MNYYTETNYIDHDSLRTAGGKGRDDYFEVLRRLGFKCIRIPTLRKPGMMPALQRPILEYRLIKAWRSALSGIGRGDTLVLHSPISEKFLAYPEVVREVKDRGCRIINIVFDLETFFKSDYRRFARLKHEADRKQEAALFGLSDVIICHNEKMKDKITSLGISPGRIVCVGVMDYLSDRTMDADNGRFSPDKSPVFCSNLSERKSGFVYRLAEIGIPGLTLDVYGPGYTGKRAEIIHPQEGEGHHESVRYRGVRTAEELMQVMEGSFGLVWDGTSVETCEGPCGEYLRYNNPHKMSHYLASGMPVLVWKEAAMAEFVLNEGCGLTIENLASIPDVLAGISAEEYERMRRNAERVGAEMRQGLHISTAVRKALEMSYETRKLNVGKALIIFTREPEPGKTKTRLMPYLSAEKCAGLHRCMLKDIRDEMKSADADIIVAYTGGQNGPEFLRRTFGGKTVFIEQRGSGIGERMQNAVADVLGLGYDRAVLIGTDIPDLEADTVDTAFAMLDFSDVVMGPTEDGGYYLIGMKEVRPEAFSVKLYGVDTVFNETVAALHGAGISVSCVDEYSDIDVPEDAAEFRRRMREDAGLRKSRTGQFLSENASVSVIVPVYNESARIGRLLTQLLPYRNECEIIIADGGSTDDTVHKAEELIAECSGGAECNVKILKNKKGRGIQMNAGALASTGDILLFLHCDSVLPEGFLREIRRTMSENDWGCFGVRFDSHNLFMITNRIMSNFRARVGRQPFGDQGIFIDREIFFGAGMFPEIPVMEDYEFSLRMKWYGSRPGMTARRITTSARRYIKPGCGLIEETRDILKTEMDMWKLRFMYRMGKSPEEIEKMYKDIR